MTLIEKLSQIQQEIKAPKSHYNKFGNYYYRNAEGILEAVKPYEAKYKVAFLLEDELVQRGDRYYIKAIASILDCEQDDFSLAVTAYAREAETKKGMDDSQITGTASSYARKYALNGLLLLDDTKDADTDEYAKQTNDPPITAAQIKTLEKLIPEHGQTIEAVCKSRRVKSLSELTTTQFIKLMDSMGEK